MVRKKRALTFELKLEVIQLLDSGMSNKEVQRTLGLLPYQIRDILRYKDKILANKDRVYTSHANKTMREEMFPDLNGKICEWMRQWKGAFGSLPSNDLIKTKALDLAKVDKSPRISTFKASNGWIYKMKDRVSREYADDSENEDEDSLMVSDYLDVRLEEEEFGSKIPYSELEDLEKAYKIFKQASLKYDIEADALFDIMETHMKVNSLHAKSKSK